MSLDPRAHCAKFGWPDPSDDTGLRKEGKDAMDTGAATMPGRPGPAPATPADPDLPAAPGTRPDERLIATGLRLFCRDGIHATGIARILAESGVSRKTLYERFGSKEALVRAVLEREGEQWRAWFAGALAETRGSGAERLLAVFDVLQTWFSQPDFFGCAFINAMAEHDKVSAPLADLAESHRVQTNAILLEIAREAGLRDPAELVERLSIVMDGTIVAAMVARDPDAATRGRAIARLVLADHPPVRTEGR